MQWMNCGREFDEIGNDFIGKELVIYGAGPTGLELYENIRFLGRIAAFVDRNKGKQIDGIDGIPVIPVLEFARWDRSKYIVVIAVKGNSGVLVHHQLMNMGFRLGVDCFFWKEFLDYYFPIYGVYACNTLYFPSISFLLTTLCNLNCKGCLNFTAYNQGKKHYDLSALKNNADIFFSRIDYVEKFHMSGGEPMLYPGYEELLDYIGGKYRGRVHNFYTATNGTVIPGDSLCEKLKQYDVFVEVDDYRSALQGGLIKNDIVIEKLRNYGIRYSDRKAGYWLNLDPKGQDNTEFDEASLRNWYDCCANPFASIHEGMLYSCNYDDYAKEAGLADKDEQDSLDLSLETDKKKILEFRMGYTGRGYTAFCRHCAGHEMTNAKHITVAEQMRREE